MGCATRALHRAPSAPNVAATTSSWPRSAGAVILAESPSRSSASVWPPRPVVGAISRAPAAPTWLRAPWCGVAGRGDLARRLRLQHARRRPATTCSILAARRDLTA